MRIKLVVAVFFTTILLISCASEQSKFTIKVFEVEKGWGYSIFEQEKLIIKQQYIPSIEEQKSFKNKKDAFAIATLVIEKLKHGNMPSVTALELKNSINL